MADTMKVWFITGAGRGFGRLWAEAALRRGDKVAASARDPKALEPLAANAGDRLLPLALDVTDRPAVFDAVSRAAAHFGRLDVVLSNAGYGVLGAVEETSFEDARAIFETNVLGTLSLIQAALPILRAQRSGHILSVTSAGGLLAFPLMAVYEATKFAIEGLGEALAQEVAEFGIKVTLIEPGPYKTDFMSGTSLKQSNALPVYQAMRERFATMLPAEIFGDPAATADAILKVVDAESPPLRLLLGRMLPLVKQAYSERLTTWEAWDAVAQAAHGAAP
ncbi:MAG TPA: SDR family NAD(P)-dependent oxidoreductase [Acetobacteraceae bacterium]|nr:SDR family NAD(P)-dependent oxidoreductase [Acetobacteraceae bacterium]